MDPSKPLVAAATAFGSVVLMGSAWYMSSKPEKEPIHRGSLGSSPKMKYYLDLEKENHQLRQQMEDLKRKLEAAEVAAISRTELEKKRREKATAEIESLEEVVEGLKIKVEELEEENEHLHQILHDTRANGEAEVQKYKEETETLLNRIRELEKNQVQVDELS